MILVQITADGHSAYLPITPEKISITHSKNIRQWEDINGITHTKPNKHIPNTYSFNGYIPASYRSYAVGGLFGASAVTWLSGITDGTVAHISIDGAGISADVIISSFDYDMIQGDISYTLKATEYLE